LGHVVLHHKVDRARLEVKSEHRLLEQQAHWFAGAFLLPAAGWAREAYALSLDGFRIMKAKWLVSMGAMIMRSESLGLVSRQQAERLWVQRARRGWSKHEPLDDDLQTKQPRVLRRAMELIITQRVQSRDDVLAALQYSASDIERLVGLAPGFLGDDDDAPLVRPLGLPPIRVNASGDASMSQGAVVPFRRRTAE
jgi:hypothetical protein